MDVTLPNGKVISGVPEGTSKEQIAQKAISAGLATAEDFGIQPQSSINIDELSEIGSAPELNQLSVPAFKASLGLLSTGDEQSIQGILKQQFGDEVSFEQEGESTLVNFPSGQYVINKPGLSGQDVIKFVSDVLAFTPAGRARSIGGAALGSAATELGLETVEQELGGEDISASEVATSGLLGGAFKGAEDLIGAGYRAVKGAFSPAQKEALEQGSDAGIPLMTSDVLPPQTFAGKTAQQTAEKIPLAGTGATREAQQQLRVDAVQDVADRYSQFSYDAITSSLKESSNKVKSAAGSVLGDTAERLDALGELPTTNTFNAISETQEALSKTGVIKNEGALSDLQVLVDAINEAPQTFSTLKENRTAFNDIIKGFDKADRSQLGSRANAALQKVQAAMKADLDTAAKNNLSPRDYDKWKKANAVYAEEATKLTKTRIKNVLDKGDVTPETVSTMLFSQKPSELKSLYGALGQGGRQNARAAIISKVVNDTSRRAGGITPNSFATELKKYKPQISTFFKGEERKQLEGLQRVLESTRRAQEASVSTPTGQQLIGAATLGAAATDLGLTTLLGGTVGSLARVYESAPVRNALLRLASVPKGSTAFEQALSEARAVLSSSAQAARTAQEE